MTAGRAAQYDVLRAKVERANIEPLKSLLFYATAEKGKATWPGRKQVWRRYEPDGRMAGDILSLEDDS